MALLVLDENVARGFKPMIGGWNTSVVIGGGGVQYPSQVWAAPTRGWEFSFVNAPIAEARAVWEMLDDCRGRAFPFLLKDWLNFELTNHIVQAAAGGETGAQVRQTWGTNNLLSLDRKHLKSGTLSVRKNAAALTSGVDYTASATAYLTFLAPMLPLLEGDVIDVTAEFYYAARFEADAYPATIDFPGRASLRSVAAIEDRAS